MGFRQYVKVQRPVRDYHGGIIAGCPQPWWWYNGQLWVSLARLLQGCKLSYIGVVTAWGFSLWLWLSLESRVTCGLSWWFGDSDTHDAGWWGLKFGEILQETETRHKLHKEHLALQHLGDQAQHCGLQHILEKEVHNWHDWAEETAVVVTQMRSHALYNL